MTSSNERTFSNISRSQLIAFATIFTALYFVLSYSISVVVGPILRGSGAHFFRAFCMVLIAAKLRSPNGPFIMGTISGILLLLVPAPHSFLYLPGSIAAGLIYDKWLQFGNYYFNSISHTKIIIGSILSGIGESVVVTTGLFLIGFNFAEIIALANSTGLGSTTLIGIWVFSVRKNIVMSFFGAVFAFGFIKSKFL